MSEDRARYGWGSNFPSFSRTPARVIRGRLGEFVRDAGERQVRAWDESIPPLQREVDEVLSVNEDAVAYSLILEYELPLECRRPYVVLLTKRAVVILELKGKLSPSQADLDQASAYARDLLCYHRECERRPCRHLDTAVTEFGAQGLELDAVLLAWGTDFVRVEDNRWSNSKARGYKRGAHVRDPFQLRLNAYRVLLTRGRDATVAFIPPIPDLDATHGYLVAGDFRSLE